MTKNIIFDCSETLFHFHSVDLLTELCGSETRARELHDLLLCSDVWGLYDNGKITTEDLASRLRTLVRADEQHIPAAYLARYIDYFVPIAGIPELLHTLREKGYRLYLLSDFPETFDRLHEKHSLFALMDELVVSYRVGVSKRDGDIFAYILSHCGLRPEECLFVDDMPQNVTKAKSYGMQALQFTGVDALRASLEL